MSLILVFFSVENIFLAHFHNIFSGILKFSPIDFRIFSRVEFSFSRSERRILRYFFIFDGKKCYFFFFFSFVKFCCFFSGTFCFSGSFQNFVSGSLKSSRAENLKFSRKDFFYRVLNLKIMSPPPQIK